MLLPPSFLHNAVRILKSSVVGFNPICLGCFMYNKVQPYTTHVKNSIWSLFNGLYGIQLFNNTAQEIY